VVVLLLGAESLGTVLGTLHPALSAPKTAPKALISPLIDSDYSANSPVEMTTKRGVARSE
jgi:hypothetical protein